MNPSNTNINIWEQTLRLSRPFWQFYESCIGKTKFDLTENTRATQYTNNDPSRKDEKADDDDVNAEYLEFISITRKHQAERDQLKESKLKEKSNDESDIYYKDVSEVNLLVENNLVEVPDRNEPENELFGAKRKDMRLLEFYGGNKEDFERIRSLEMEIDEHFSESYQKLQPKYWPTMPMNPRPYLAPLVLN